MLPKQVRSPLHKVLQLGNHLNSGIIFDDEDQNKFRLRFPRRKKDRRAVVSMVPPLMYKSILLSSCAESY